MSLLKIKNNKEKILNHKEKIVKILNENIDLEYKLLVKGMIKTYDKEMNIGTHKKPKMAVVTFGTWKEFFYDQEHPNDKKHAVSVERNMPIAIDGIPSDYYRPLTYYTIEDI